LCALIANPTTKNTKRITFSISTTDCSHGGQKRFVPRDLIEPLERYKAVVYSGLLRFDYFKELGDGERCGTVEEAFEVR